MCYVCICTTFISVADRHNYEDDSIRLKVRKRYHGIMEDDINTVIDKCHGSFLPLSVSVCDSSVFDELVKKHPIPSQITPMSLVFPVLHH